MDGDSLVVLIPITVIAGLWAFLIVRAVSRSKVRELEIRERIALIEKGHVPAPEVDPKGFERAMKRRDRDYRYGYATQGSRGSFRHRRAGTTLVGVGLGLMIMIAFAGEAPQQAIGVGGFLVMIGLAFVVNGFIEQRGGPEPLQEPRDSSIPMQTPKAD
jgi:hypothetical protein